ncbi:MAG: hypothetical protein ACRC57_04730 [Sarcina sp.]
MKSVKIPVTNFISLSKTEKDLDIQNTKNLLVGNYKFDEYRTILEFLINPKIFKFKILKAELVFFLTNTKIDFNIEALMLNIARNINCLHTNNINFCTSPKFFQDASFSKLTNQLSNNFIRIDITKLIEYWIKNKITKFSFTLLCLSQDSLAYISCASNFKPFIDISLNEHHAYNDCNNSHYNYSPDNNGQNHYDSYDNNNYHNHTSCNEYNEESKYYDDFNLKSSNENEDILMYSNNITNSDTCYNNESSTSQVSNSNIFGNFISINEMLERHDGFSYIKFDSETITAGTNLNINKDGIFIRSKGIYKVDYMVNCRAEPFSTVALELDGITVAHTKLQIASHDSITSGTSILIVDDNNMILKLKISTINTLLVNTGLCASINIVKIN